MVNILFLRRLEVNIEVPRGFKAGSASASGTGTGAAGGDGSSRMAGARSSGSRARRAFSRLRAVSFDLFDTLVTIDPGRLPTLDLAGELRPSTAPPLLAVVRRFVPDLDGERFLSELVPAFRSAREALVDPLAELHPRAAFQLLTERLGVPETAAELANELERVHARTLARATVPLPGARGAVAQARELGLMTVLTSNLDFGPLAAWLLARAGLAGHFDGVVLSCEIGYRKPHPAIFQAVLSLLKLEPAAVLHLGDHPIADVQGAAALGLTTAWVRPEGRTFPPDLPAPDLTAASAAEVVRQLRDDPGVRGT